MDLIIESATDQAPALDRTVYVPPYMHLWHFHHHHQCSGVRIVNRSVGAPLRDVRIEMSRSLLHASENN